MTRTVKRAPIAVAIYAGLVALTVFGFMRTPAGFIPQQDKLYLVGVVQLPPAATLERTAEVVRRMGEIAKAEPGVLDSVQFAGVSANGFAAQSSAALVFFPLKDFDEREGTSTPGQIAGALNQKFGAIQDAYIAVFPPPPVIGLGMLGGFKLNVEDRQNRGAEALYAAVQDALQKAWADPSLAGVFSSYQINVPQLDVDVDRLKVKRQGVQLNDVFQTLQVNLGSLYVNDFNRFGRTYRVVAQADAPFRSQVDDILPLKTRNAAGEMVPLGSMISVKESFGPGHRRAFQRLCQRRHQRRAFARPQLGPGAGRDREDPRREPAAPA